MTIAQRVRYHMGFMANSGREGQRASNALWAIDPHLHRGMRRAGLDPFYDDAKLPEFWSWLEQLTPSLVDSDE